MIGIFDSGVGGMTVARAVEKILPEHRIVYFGDLARTPYGTKSPETIINYSLENTEFLLSQGAKIIIIACNSAASVATTILQRTFSMPLFEVITPAITKAIEVSASGNIGVIGTTATIRSGIYEREILRRAPDHRVSSQACPLLVPLVEEGWLDKRETKMIVRGYLSSLKQKQVDTLVLGCTHYPLLKEIIAHKIGGKKVVMVDSSNEVAHTLKSFLEAHPAIDATLSREGENRYFVSDITAAADAISRNIFGRAIKLVKV